MSKPQGPIREFVGKIKDIAAKLNWTDEQAADLLDSWVAIHKSGEPPPASTWPDVKGLLAPEPKGKQ